jgi:NADPH:quinone reductase-like Zn-dependent oxidoreductase
VAKDPKNRKNENLEKPQKEISMETMKAVGGDTQRRSWKVVKKGGILVSIVGPPSAEEAAAHGVRQASVFVQPSATQLTELANLVDSGKLKPVVETVLPLSEARRAHELSQTGHTHGKIVLRVV